MFVFVQFVLTIIVPTVYSRITRVMEVLSTTSVEREEKKKEKENQIEWITSEDKQTVISGRR